MIAKPNTSESHWARHATQWKKVGSPLRPVAEDAYLYWHAITSTLTESELATARVLLLGVTPELASLPWPMGASMLACDSSFDMLQTVWPWNRFPGVYANALNADWRALPFAPGACELIVGDGCLNILSHADDYRQCAREFYRVLQPSSCLVLRLFCAPDVPESPEQVLAALRRGQVGNFHAFKWRLVTAIHAGNENACLADVWTRWESEFPEPEVAAELSGWSLEAIRTLEAYRNASARYSLYSLAEIGSMLSSEFEFLGAAWPGYELGERFPIASFRRAA
jgi:SAM-dependent methyltransferase